MEIWDPYFQMKDNMKRQKHIYIMLFKYLKIIMDNFVLKRFNFIEI